MGKGPAVKGNRCFHWVKRVKREAVTSSVVLSITAHHTPKACAINTLHYIQKDLLALKLSYPDGRLVFLTSRVVNSLKAKDSVG